MKKLSEIVLEMAVTLLKHPNIRPSTEAAHTALLFTHVVWNKTIGVKDIEKVYERVLQEFETSNPKSWDEFNQTDHKKIIKSLIFSKMNFIQTI